MATVKNTTEITKDFEYMLDAVSYAKQHAIPVYKIKRIGFRQVRMVWKEKTIKQAALNIKEQANV